MVFVSSVFRMNLWTWIEVLRFNLLEDPVTIDLAVDLTLVMEVKDVSN